MRGKSLSFKVLTVFILSMLISSLTVILPFADVDVESVKSIQKSNDYVDSYYGLHLEEREDAIFNVDKNNHIVYGYSYDEIGNIYYTYYLGDGPGLIESGVLRNKEGKNGVYYDENGHLINPSSKIKYKETVLDNGLIVQDIVDYKSLCLEFESNKYIELKTLQDIEDFLEYYILQYSYESLKADKYLLERVSILDLNGKELNVGYRLSLASELTDREKIKDLVLAKFGPVQGNTTQEKMYDVCDKINQLMEYDLEYEPLSLVDAVADMRGVCWQYAKIAKILLEDAGIENEIMLGYLNGKIDEAHAWIRVTDKVYDEGFDENSVVKSYTIKYYYMDPTTVKATDDYKYSNIGYKEYCRRYEVSKYLDIY